jgi:two-component system, OmpR family, response regulator RpaB
MTKSSILLVDNDDTLREVLQVTLEDLGYTVHSAADGQHALRLFHSHPIDLAVLDIEMPGMNGFVLYAELQKHRQVPVIFISGLEHPKERQLAISLGAVDFLHKPFSLSALEHSIQHALSSTS